MIAFNPDMLELKRITYETSNGAILEKIARGENVHIVRGLSDLKRRFNNGRCCYALFHRSLPNEPINFIHVALSNQLLESMR